MMDCDFIPASYHAAASQQRTLRNRALFIGGMIAIMSLWLASHHQQMAQADLMLAEVEQQERQILIHLAKKELMVQEGDHLMDRQHLIEELSRSSSLVVAFADISRRLPETVVLTHVELNESSILQYGAKGAADVATLDLQVPLPSALAAAVAAKPPPDRARLKIGGVARSTPDILEFTAALENSTLVDKARTEIRGPGAWAGRQVQRFELVCELYKQEVVQP